MGIEIIACNSHDELRSLKDRSENLSRCVILLNPDLAYGTDIRLKEQATCVVYAEVMPNTYDYLQYCGRTQRANVRSQCRLFTVGSPDAATKYERSLEDFEDAPFV